MASRNVPGVFQGFGCYLPLAAWIQAFTILNRTESKFFFPCLSGLNVFNFKIRREYEICFSLTLCEIFVYSVE